MYNIFSLYIRHRASGTKWSVWARCCLPLPLDLDLCILPINKGLPDLPPGLVMASKNDLKNRSPLLTLISSHGPSKVSHNGIWGPFLSPKKPQKWTPNRQDSAFGQNLIFSTPTRRNACFQSPHRPQIWPKSVSKCDLKTGPGKSP